MALELPQTGVCSTDRQFAVRAGYFHESENAGNRKFITFGVGLKLVVASFDFSYLLANNNNPLANTLRFTISFNFGSKPIHS